MRVGKQAESSLWAKRAVVASKQRRIVITIIMIAQRYLVLILAQVLFSTLYVLIHLILTTQHKVVLLVIPASQVGAKSGEPCQQADPEADLLNLGQNAAALSALTASAFAISGNQANDP